MKTYLIVLYEKSRDDWKALKQTWPDHHILTDRLAVIKSEDKRSDVANAMGMGPESNVYGLVCDVDSGGLYGFNSMEFWDWIEKER